MPAGIAVDHRPGDRRRRRRGDDRMSAVRDTMPPAPDAESRLHDAHHVSLRLWLRLLTCTLMIERPVRSRLRERFATTLPRFDLMAQLERAPEGLKMSELSRRMMVTSGNVTGITDQLAAEGMVERRPIEGEGARALDRGHGRGVPARRSRPALRAPRRAQVVATRQRH